MSMSIAGMATANPDHVLTQDDALELAQQVFAGEDRNRTLRAIYRRSGIKTRRTLVSTDRVRSWLGLGPASADLNANLNDTDLARGGTQTAVGRGATTKQRMELYRDEAPRLAWQSSQSALARAELPAREITHLITVSCSGLMSPGLDVELIERLGLSPNVQRTHIGYMACHGAMNGLRVARSFTASDLSARVLLCSVELCSLHYYSQWDPARFMANVIFGDGAAALVGRASTDAGEWKHVASGSCLIPDSKDILQHNVCDHGFEVVLSARLPDLIQQHLRPWLEQWLRDHDLSLDRIGCWAIHPGGPRVLSAVQESLGLPAEATAVSRDVLNEFGNMSSATVLFILDRLRRADAPLPCVALAFGPGLTAEVAIFA